MAQGVWALRRLGAQEPLRVGCPRVCIELMYQSSGYRTRFDIKQALTSINQPPPASSVLNDPDVWSARGSPPVPHAGSGIIGYGFATLVS